MTRPKILQFVRLAGLLIALASPVWALWDHLTAAEIFLSLRDATARAQVPRGLAQENMTVAGESHLAIFAHPPSRIAWAVKLRRGQHRFVTRVALKGEAWTKSDGVGFRASIVDNGNEREICRLELDPRIGPPRWIFVDGTFTTSGAEVLLILETSDGPDNRRDWDWALWGAPHITETSDLPHFGPTLFGLAIFLIALATERSPQMWLRGVPRLLPRLHLGTAALATCTLTLLLFEAVLRLFPLLLPFSAYEELPEGGRQTFTEENLVRRYDSELGFQNPPQRQFRYQPRIYPRLLRSVSAAWWKRDATRISFATDEEGFRNPPGLKDAEIIIVGDSFVEGSMVPYDKVWTSVLAKLSGSRVRNLGVGGYGPQQIQLALERYGLPRKPRWVVWAFYEGNDIPDADQYQRFRASGLSWPEFLSTGQRLAGPSFKTRRLDHSLSLAALRHISKDLAETAGRGSSGVRALQNGAFNPVCEAGVERRTCHAFIDSQLYRSTFSRSRWETHPGWRPTLETLRRAKDICHANGARIMVVTHPSKGSVYLPLLRAFYSEEDFNRFVANRARLDRPAEDSWHQMFVRNHTAQTEILTEALDREGILHLDLRPEFEAAAARGEQLFLGYDSHWNASGHRLAAEILAGKLQ